MAIKWFSKAEKDGIATIYPTNITINKVGANHIAYAYGAMLAIDVEEGKIIVKPLRKDEIDSGNYSKDNIFIFSASSSYTRINSTAFVNRVCQLFNLNIDKEGKKFTCNYSSESNLLIIDMKKEVTN